VPVSQQNVSPWKICSGRDNHGFDMSPLIEILPVASSKKSPHYMIAPRKVFPGRQFTGKNSSGPGGRGAGGFLPGETFCGRSCNGAPARHLPEFVTHQRA